MTDPHGDCEAAVHDRNVTHSLESATPTIELTHRDARSLLSDYLDGSLDPAKQRLMEAHLDLCRDCRAFRDTFRQTVHALDSLPPRPAPAGFKGRLLGQVHIAEVEPS